MPRREKFPIRIVLPLTEEQAQQIEDWRYDNRVPARVEAIRELIRLGLEASKQRKETAKKSAL